VLTTAALKLSDILNGPYLLNVPVYQRPYSWAAQQVQQLIDDLAEASGASTDGVADESYFLGTILLMDTVGNRTERLTPKMPSREFDIVDGQQRLVTLLTLFCVLRDLEQNSKRVVGKIVQTMVSAQLGKPFFRTERLRMHLSSRDRTVFEKYILQPGRCLVDAELATPSPSEAAMLAMRDILVAEMSSLSEEARVRLFNFAIGHCRLVVIVSHDIDRAHRTFVVLNERGKKLQRDDILKADILSRAASADIDWIAEKWDQAGAQLGDDFEVFFSHVRKIYGYDNRQIVSGVRAVVSDVGGAAPFMRTVLLPLAASYQIVRSGDAPGLPPEISQRLRYLNRLADGDWAPAAMLALRDWQADPDRAIFLISEIDRMAHVVRLLCAGNGKRVRRLGEIVDAIRDNVVLDESHPAFQVSREETRSIAFHLKDIHKRGPKICKLMLMRLGDVGGGKFVDADPDRYTIEHILPQRPSATSEWRKLFPTSEDRSQCVESLGNLVLISQEQNDRARNASFEAKKAIYAVATAALPLLAITADVLGESEWRREDIERREQRLLTMIANLWRIDILPSKGSNRQAADSLDLSGDKITRRRASLV
jgi:Protein of unknown function DUF262/Protein of unknown function (DUF1524)